MGQVKVLLARQSPRAFDMLQHRSPFLVQAVANIHERGREHERERHHNGEHRQPLIRQPSRRGSDGADDQPELTVVREIERSPPRGARSEVKQVEQKEIDRHLERQEQDEQ